MPGSNGAADCGMAGRKTVAVVLTHDGNVERWTGAGLCNWSWWDFTLLCFIQGNYHTPRKLQELVQNGFEVGVHDLKHNGRLYRSRRDFRINAERINSYLRDWGAVGFRSGFMLHNLDWLHELEIEYDASTFDTDPFEPQPEGRHTIFPCWIPRLPTVPASASNGDAHAAHSADGSSTGDIELPYTLQQDSTLPLPPEPSIDL